MRSAPSFRFALLLVVLVAYPAAAQDEQVPFDEAGRLYVIDAEQADRLDLFGEYTGFFEARLYHVGGGDYELEVVREEGGRRLREREPLDAAALSALRRRVEAALVATGGRTRLDQEGRRKLLGTTTLLGGAYGALLPATLGAEDAQVYGTTVPLGYAAGFFVPFFLTQDADVTEAQATFTWYGGLQGAGHGALVALLLGGDAVSGRGVAGLALLGSAVQAGLGFGRADDDWGLSAGAGETMALGSAYGFGMGLGASVLVLADADLDDQVWTRVVSGLSLGGSLAGSYGAYRMARDARYTQGDARIMALLTTFGAQVGGTVLYLLDEDDLEARTAAATLMGSGTAGLVAGHYFVRGRDFGRAQANIIALGSYAGSLLGGAVTVALEASDEAALLLGNLGTALGFGLTYAAFADDVRTTASDWHLELRPEGLLAQRALERAGRLDRLAPILTLRRRF